MNSDMVKPEKFGHFHLVYQFTVPLSKTFVFFFQQKICFALGNVVLRIPKNLIASAFFC